MPQSCLYLQVFKANSHLSFWAFTVEFVLVLCVYIMCVFVCVKAHLCIFTQLFRVTSLYFGKKYSEHFSLTVFSCHVTYAFARSRREIWRWSDCNWTRTHNHLVLKQKLKHLAKLAKWLSVSLKTKWFWVQVHLQSLI